MIRPSVFANRSLSLSSEAPPLLWRPGNRDPNFLDDYISKGWLPGLEKDIPGL